MGKNVKAMQNKRKVKRDMAEVSTVYRTQLVIFKGQSHLIFVAVLSTVVKIL